MQMHPVLHGSVNSVLHPLTPDRRNASGFALSMAPQLLVENVPAEFTANGG